MANETVLKEAAELFERSYEAYAQRRLDEAEQLTLKAKALWEQELGVESLPVSTCLNNLGRICEETDRPEEGIAWHRAALALRKRLLGDHPETAFCYGNLGTALAMAGHLEEAVETLAAAVECFDRRGDTGGHDVSGYQRNLEICRAALAEQQA